MPDLSHSTTNERTSIRESRGVGGLDPCARIAKYLPGGTLSKRKIDVPENTCEYTTFPDTASETMK